MRGTTAVLPKGHGRAPFPAGSSMRGRIMNCPINEQTADGTKVGRCWFFLTNGVICPRHENAFNCQAVTGICDIIPRAAG